MSLFDAIPEFGCASLQAAAAHCERYDNCHQAAVFGLESIKHFWILGNNEWNRLCIDLEEIEKPEVLLGKLGQDLEEIQHHLENHLAQIIIVPQPKDHFQFFVQIYDQYDNELNLLPAWLGRQEAVNILEKLLENGVNVSYP
jgi:hypothetical protein